MTEQSAAAIFQAKLAALHAQFRAELPGKIEQMQSHVDTLTQCWSGAEAVELHRQVHSLTGAAGTFGCADLSQHARALERLLKPWIKQSQHPVGEESAGNENRGSNPFDSAQWQAILAAWQHVAAAAAAVTAHAG